MSGGHRHFRKRAHERPRGERSTPAGEHRPVMLEEVLAALAPEPSQTVVDCTVGWAGHAAELLRHVGANGRVIAMDFDADNLPRARERLEAVGFPFSLHHGNFAGLAQILEADGLAGVDMLLADLGMSSMQVDDADRGFSYVRDGPLDMRMDRSRGRTAAQLLDTIAAADLAQALRDLGDEPEADRIAQGIVAAREAGRPIQRTRELAQIIVETMKSPQKNERWQLHPAPNRWQTHPAARSFQALRILLNRELSSLEHLLRVLPSLLNPGGRAAIISFHSGEDRLVKAAFRDGLRAGIFAAISPEPIRPTFNERSANPRSRSAKLRWARVKSNAE